MNAKYNGLQNLFSINGLGLLLILLFNQLLMASNEPVKGLWVVRHALTSPAEIDSLMNFSKKLGITDLFVQVRGRGDAYYSSKFEPKAEEIPDKEFDPLAFILQHPLCDSIKIHAWLNVFYVWSKDSLPKDLNHIVHRQSNWLAQPAHQPELIKDYPNSVKEAKIEGLYVSPLQPDAQEHFLAIIIDLLSKYDLSGIHLDYIRYPDQRYDLNPDVIKGFKNRYIINPEKFLLDPEVFAQKFSVAGYEVFYHHWRRYLLDGLSDFVRRISETVHSNNEKIVLSAAVKPNIVQAHWNFYQDWDRWIRQGWIDLAVPMNYSPDIEIFRGNINDYLDNLPQDKYLIGIALYNQSEPEAIRKIAQVRALQNSGFVLFSYQQLIRNQLIQKYLKEMN
jgi:uncharacterized lipoprotein YddW (UPF0748 family)